MTFSHLVSLSVGVDGSPGHGEVYQQLSSVADRVRDAGHPYVSLTSQDATDAFDQELEDAGCTEEHLHHDENTLVKVREALVRATGPYGHGDQYVTDLISEMLSAGILFRERRNTKEND